MLKVGLGTCSFGVWPYLNIWLYYDKGFQVSQKQPVAKMACNYENNKRPWGGNQTHPELDEVIKAFKNKFNPKFGGGSSGKGGVSKAAIGRWNYFVILAVLL